MSAALTIECEVHFDRKGRGSRKVLETGPSPFRPAEPGRVPRVARLMALALRCEGLLRSGAVENQTEIARLGHVTRARVSQILNLLNLAPDIQEAILDLPRTLAGRDAVILRQVLPIASTMEWAKQRGMWEGLGWQPTSDSTKLEL